MVAFANTRRIDLVVRPTQPPLPSSSLTLAFSTFTVSAESLEICTLVSHPSVPTNSKVLPQRSLYSPGCLQAHEVQDGNGGPQARCPPREGDGRRPPAAGDDFSPELSWLCSVARCSCPRARAVGVGDLEALSRKAFKCVPAGLWCGCFGPGRARARAAVRKILLESCLVGRATRVSRPGGFQRLCRPRSQRPSRRGTVRRNQPG